MTDLKTSHVTNRTGSILIINSASLSWCKLKLRISISVCELSWKSLVKMKRWKIGSNFWSQKKVHCVKKDSKRVKILGQKHLQAVAGKNLIFVPSLFNFQNVFCYYLLVCSRSVLKFRFCEKPTKNWKNLRSLIVKNF